MAKSGTEILRKREKFWAQNSRFLDEIVQKIH